MTQIEINEQEYISKLTDTAWTIAYTSLWNGETLSMQEVALAKRLVHFHIVNHDDLFDGYMIYCQRVLLARDYLSRNPEKFVPRPSLWMHPSNTNGYMGTAVWYNNMAAVRKALPLYRHQMKTLPEAVLDMRETPTPANFHYWRTWFIVRRKQASMNLFLAILSNSRYEM